MDITIFKNDKFGEVRTVADERGEPLFVANDVARALGYADCTRAVKDHVREDDRVKRTPILDALGRSQLTLLINESGLYSLIMGSKLPQAREFKHWVTAEVLPQIRKTGRYISVGANDDDNMVLAKALLIGQW